MAIVGGSGSGKSWLAERLQRELSPHSARLSQDDFYLDRSYLTLARRARLNFDHPRAIDWREFQQALGRLRLGHPATVPVYDFATHTRLAERLLRPTGVLLVDGLWLLRRRELRRMFDFAIFLNVSATRRLTRRLNRDISERGRTPASVREQFLHTVEPMHRKYVQPQARWADLVLGRNCSAIQVAGIAACIRALNPEAVYR